MHSVLSAFEQDRLDYCIDAVRKENAGNYNHKQRSVELSQLKESVNGSHLVKNISLQQMTGRTIFLRTKSEIQTNFKQVFLLYLYGMKYTELDT